MCVGGWCGGVDGVCVCVCVSVRVLVCVGAGVSVHDCVCVCAYLKSGNCSVFRVFFKKTECIYLSIAGIWGEL